MKTKLLLFALLFAGSAHALTPSVQLTQQQLTENEPLVFPPVTLTPALLRAMAVTKLQYANLFPARADFYRGQASALLELADALEQGGLVK